MKIRLLLSIFFITALVACGGAEERKAVYIEKAKSSIEAGDFDKARIELKNVLQIDPKDGEAYYYLGTVFEEKKEFRKAYRNYLRAEELAPDLLSNHARLGRFYLLLMNDSEKGQEKVNLILSKEPNNPDGLLLKAIVMLRNGNRNEAIKTVKSIIDKEKGHVEASLYLATFYMKDDKTPDALDALDKALKINPDNVKLNTLLLSILVKNKDYERAEGIYKKFLLKNPGNSTSYNNLAVFYNLKGDKVKAEATFRASVENDPGDVDRQLTLIQYIKLVKGSDEAIKELKNFIALDASSGMLRLALADLLYQGGDKMSSIETYKKAINDFTEEVTGVESRVSLASIYINDKNISDAKAIIDEAISISPNDSRVNLLRARLALFEKDIETAIISLRIVTKETPENIEAYFLLVSAYGFEGNEEQVRATLNKAYENNKINSDALLKLSQYYLTRDIELSEKIIDDYNNLKESDYDGLSIKASILNQKKMLSEGREIAEVLMNSFPDKPNGYILASPYYLSNGETQKATTIIENGYINAKDNRKLLFLLTTLQVSAKQFDVAEKRIKAELVVSPGDGELNILLAKVYMANKDVDSAEVLLSEVIENSPDLEEPYLLLAKIYQYKKDADSVKSLLLKGRDNVVSSIKIPLGLAAIYQVDKDYQKAISVYRDLYESSQDNLIVINNLASLLSDYGDENDDLKFIKMLAKKLEESNQPAFLDTTGWVYYKSGDYNKAVQHLSQAVEKFPDVNVINYHLGMAYKQTGDKAQAKVYLEKSLTGNENFNEKIAAQAALKDL